MPVAKHIKDNPFLYDAIYAQPKGPVGAVAVTVIAGERLPERKQILLSLMPRETDPAADAEFVETIRKLGDKQFRLAGSSVLGQGNNPDEMQFLVNNKIIDATATVSPAITTTHLTLADLMRAKLVNTEVANELLADVSRICTTAYRPSDIKSMPFEHKMRVG